MTKISMKNALLVGDSFGEGMYEITLACRRDDVELIVDEINNLQVEIRSKDHENQHQRKSKTVALPD